jgi:NitT/TauT family transport system substrate-binding protein
VNRGCTDVRPRRQGGRPEEGRQSEEGRSGRDPRRRVTRPRRRAGIALLLVLGLVLAACGGGSSEATDDAGSGGSTPPSTSGGTASGSADALAPQPLAERTKVVVGWSGAYEVWASAIVAEGMGEFEAENLDVEFTTITASDAIAGMETGRLDVMVGSISAGFFNAIDGGAKFRWVAPAFLPATDTKEGLWMANTYLDASGKPKVDTLSGTKLGLGSGGAGASIAPIVNEWLAESGLSLGDFEYLNATGPDILVALESGAISAGWLSDPYWVEAEKSGKATLVMSFPPDASLSGYVLSNELLTDKTEVGEAFTRALARTNRDHLAGDYHADPAVVDVLAKAIGVDAATIGAGWGYRFPADLAFDHNIVTTLQDVWIEVGDILAYDKALPPDRIIDTAVVPTAR